MINKKGNVWLWVLILIIVVVAAGVIIYYFMSGNDGGISSIFTGNSMPQPPALPSG